MKWFFLLPALCVPAVLAADQTTSAASSPQTIRVGVYVLNVGKFDLSTGSYTMDFYLNLKSNQPILENALEFINGRAASFEKVLDHPTEKTYRVLANLYDNINLKAYPFDAHALSIQLEDKTRGARDVVYQPDPENSGIDPDVTIVGWELHGWDARSVVHEYKVFGENYSRFVFTVSLRRITLTAILKAFLPAAFIVLIGLLSLLLRPDKVAARLGLNTSTLLGAVMFHLAVTSQIPPVGYLTFADKFMLASYLVLGLALLSTIFLMRHSDKKEEALAENIYRKSLLFLPPLSALLYALTFLGL